MDTFKRKRKTLCYSEVIERIEDIERHYQDDMIDCLTIISTSNDSEQIAYNNSRFESDTYMVEILNRAIDSIIEKYTEEMQK